MILLVRIMRKPFATIDTNQSYRLTVSLFSKEQNGYLVTKEEVEFDQNLCFKTAYIYCTLSWKGHESTPCSEGFIIDVYNKRIISLFLPSPYDDIFSLILSVVWLNASCEVLYDHSKKLNFQIS